MKIIKYISCFFVLFFWVEGCTSKSVPIETPNLSNDTPAPVHAQETTLPVQPFEETPLDGQEAPTLIQPSGKVIHDSSYLQDCRLQYPTKNDRQVDFRNVYPGITTVPDMLEKFGQPNKSSGDDDQGYQYIYINKERGYSYDFFTKDHIIKGVSVDDPEIVVPLKDILNKYGCPDLIVAESGEDDTIGAPIIFNGVSFTYLNAGLLIRFDGYPIEYTSIPDVFAFMNPAYLKETEFVNNKYAVLASFSEAVVQK
jgi:hypothetical protein